MLEINASKLMYDFACRSGVSDEGRPPKRYLWTDAFAVCNFLDLYLEAGDRQALDLAQRLVLQTHEVLGRHRPDDTRKGWISGLSEAEGAAHPTLGGLRIGKELPERRVEEPFDAELEWERDGQYFHYLTKWMHALARLAQVTKEPTYRRWAYELAKTAHARFMAPSSSRDVPALYWKMSIDLSRPQIASMGQHDGLDGWLTYQELQTGGDAGEDFDLREETHDFELCCAGQRWETEDTLGIGGLLGDAWRLARLIALGRTKEFDRLVELLRASLRGLDTLLRQQPFERSAESRLAFRELGLSIGLLAMERLKDLVERSPEALFGNGALRETLAILARCEFIAKTLANFWGQPMQRASASWRAHRDINEVMLATSLSPEGYLGGPG